MPCEKLKSVIKNLLLKSANPNIEARTKQKSILNLVVIAALECKDKERYDSLVNLASQLLKHGANPNVALNSEETILDCIVTQRSIELFKIIKPYGAKLFDQLPEVSSTVAFPNKTITDNPTNSFKAQLNLVRDSENSHLHKRTPLNDTPRYGHC